jgi:hypothetical protein
LSSTAATIAAAALPPSPSTETAANCAEPPNVVADIAIGASVPIPAARASTPNETANASPATATGRISRTPLL